MAAVTNGPRRAPIAELLRGMIEVLRAHGAPMVWIILVVGVPLRAIGVGASLLIAGSDSEYAYNVGIVADLIVSLLVSVVVTAACLHVALQARAGHQVTWAQGLAVAATLILPLAVITVLVTLGLVGGLLLFVLPGIWLGVLWSLAVPVLVVEGKRSTGALRRSSALVRGRWWSTFGALLVGYLLGAVLAGIVQNVLLIAMSAAPGAHDVATLVARAAAGAIGHCISYPITATFLALLYLALRDSEGPVSPVAPAVQAPMAPAYRPAVGLSSGPAIDAQGVGGYLPPLAPPASGDIAPPPSRPPGAG